MGNLCACYARKQHDVETRANTEMNQSILSPRDFLDGNTASNREGAQNSLSSTLHAMWDQDGEVGDGELPIMTRPDKKRTGDTDDMDGAHSSLAKRFTKLLSWQSSQSSESATSKTNKEEARRLWFASQDHVNEFDEQGFREFIMPNEIHREKNKERKHREELGSGELV